MSRASCYGTFIVLCTALLRVVGVDGVWVGVFSACISLFPLFTGATSDRMGFRNSLLLAFALLAAGYGSLGVYHRLRPVSVGLLLIVVGGAFVKPVITGTAVRAGWWEAR